MFCQEIKIQCLPRSINTLGRIQRLGSRDEIVPFSQLLTLITKHLSSPGVDFLPSYRLALRDTVCPLAWEGPGDKL